MKILVVDDEYSFGSLLSRALKRLGHQSSVVAHPADALETFREDSFDAVITDIDMPDMNGVELATKLRDEHNDIPVAFCTGSDPGAKAMRDAKLIGEVLPKVWTVAQVKAVVDGLSSLSNQRKDRLARGSEVLIPTTPPSVPKVGMKRRAATVPGRRMRRKIKVNCKTWSEVQKLCDDQSDGRNLLTIRGKHPLQDGDKVTVALRLPDELVLSIAARVERVRPAKNDTYAYSIRLIGLTPEMTTKMRSLILESTSSQLKPSYMKVNKLAQGSDTEIQTSPEGAVLGNLRLRKQIDSIGRLGTDNDADDTINDTEDLES